MSQGVGAEPSGVQLVLDTNIWLDWFVFTQTPDSPIAQLQAYVAQQPERRKLLMTQAMWDEWVDVLGRAQFKVAPERQAQILAQTRALVTMLDTLPAPLQRIRCADGDDQVFIDVALACRADFLISKDKHLLRLRNRARAWGVQVVTPEVWLKAQG